jgi:integrase
MKNYTLPKLVKGKRPSKIPKGSNIDKELAKNIWYVNYTYDGKQYRVKEGINRIHDYMEKKRQAELLLAGISHNLKNGYNPNNPKEYFDKLSKPKKNLKGCIDLYISDLASYARLKTVQSYRSKLLHLLDGIGSKEINEIQSVDIENYIHGKIHTNASAKMFLGGKTIELSNQKWTNKTSRNARGVFRAFFNWCIKQGLYEGANPAGKIDLRRIRSEVKPPDRNIPFTQGDMTAILNYLDEHDPYSALFCRFIYFTCMRPGEIAKLTLGDIDLSNHRITVPLNVTKNTKKLTEDVISIDKNLAKLLNELKIETYPKNYFLFSSSISSIIGKESIGNNIPYKRFQKALKALNLGNNGYTQYSFKHFSNINRLNHGWTLAEIMKANRHSSISQTEKYLKDITRVTDISNKEIPAI